MTPLGEVILTITKSDPLREAPSNLADYILFYPYHKLFYRFSH